MNDEPGVGVEPEIQLTMRSDATRGKGIEMRKVIVTEWMTLDGVVQAPGTADEDTSGVVAHGGWHLRYFDDASQQ
jgi:hypothetical protein